MSNQGTERSFSVKKIQPYFVDEIANISISPNGACRLQFASWQTDENGEPLRVDSELIMTMKTLRTLSDALPNAISAAVQKISERDKVTLDKGH